MRRLQQSDDGDTTSSRGQVEQVRHDLELVRRDDQTDRPATARTEAHQVSGDGDVALIRQEIGPELVERGVESERLLVQPRSEPGRALAAWQEDESEPGLCVCARQGC